MEPLGVMRLNGDVYIGLGSNLGDCVENLQSAISSIAQLSDFLVSSSVYVSSAAGFTTQPKFFNAACRIGTTLNPFELLHALLGIENQLGRSRTFVNSPRRIDLDILLWGDLRIEAPHLKIPHPRLHERGFALAPLLEIDPSLVHPSYAVALKDFYEQLPEAEKPFILEV